MVCYDNASCLYPTTGRAPQVFSSALQFFAAAQCLLSPPPLPEADIHGCEQFDFIVVGAGTAGCVVANRLTENKNITVLLIEAGGDAPIESRIPGLENSIYDSKFDWKYLTTNDGRINQANRGGSIVWPRGKMLGGSSNANSMIYIKGRRYDYEQWYKAGNVDWHPDIVETYFKKIENYQNQILLQNPAISKEYGLNGPLVINTHNVTFRNLAEKIVDSWNELGITKFPDLNLPGVFRSGISSVTATDGMRQSSEIAYIYPIRNRPNLKIMKNTLVTQILIDKYKKAYGVEVKRKRKLIKICARLEVIISAGTINSPQLLMLSGIGEKEQLESKNIFCKVNAPHVGQNLQDHCIVPITIYGNGPIGPDTEMKHFNAIEYLHDRTYLAVSSLFDVMAFYSSSSNLSFPEYQNHLHVYYKNMSASIYQSYSNTFRFKEPVTNSMIKLNKNHTLFIIQFNLLHPESRGNISLRTNDPSDHPLIYPNYFLSPNDLDSAVVGIKIMTKIVHTTYFKSINGFLGRLKWPECDEFELDSDNYWKCICLNMVLTVYHPVGTCKMGSDPKTSVVDSRLRVHGVQNLRVIDASIMPTITSGNTNAPTFMIAERGIDLLKQDHIQFATFPKTDK